MNKKSQPQGDIEKKGVPGEGIWLDHIAVAVRNIEVSADYYRTLGYRCGEIVIDPRQGSKLLMCKKPNCISIELVAPAQDQSPIHRILSTNGDWPYHLCYRVKDVAGFLTSMEQQGITFKTVSDLKPAVLFDNKKVMFIKVIHVGLVELLEDKPANYQWQEQEKVKQNAVRIVIDRPGPPVNFYKHLGYQHVKDIHTEKQLEIIMKKPGAGEIELVVPLQETLKENEFLNNNGPHVYQLCFEEGAVDEAALKCGDMMVDYMCIRKKLPH